MKADSLWCEVRASKGTPATVILRRCPNCGEVKVLSNPCGFDHLAALREFGEVQRRREAK